MGSPGSELAEVLRVRGSDALMLLAFPMAHLCVKNEPEEEGAHASKGSVHCDRNLNFIP